MRLVDIHTHILPYVDDGSPDMETSIELIKYEMNQGVNDLFITPHYFRFREFLSTYEENAIIFNKLLEEIKKQNMDINLYLGNEIFCDQLTLKHLETKTVVPLGGSKYVLVEFSLYHDTGAIPEAINDLTARGYIPIIAHPERYTYLTQIADYTTMKKMGARIQINVGSILGDYGRKIKKFVFKLIQNNLVDFIASDIHDFRRRGFRDAFEVIEKRFSPAMAERLFNNREILG